MNAGDFAREQTLVAWKAIERQHAYEETHRLVKATLLIGLQVEVLLLVFTEHCLEYVPREARRFFATPLDVEPAAGSLNSDPGLLVHICEK